MSKFISFIGFNTIGGIYHAIIIKQDAGMESPLLLGERATVRAGVFHLYYFCSIPSGVGLKSGEGSVAKEESNQTAARMERSADL